ncbi:MAG TPA: hypothetical protein VKF62_04345, partial [Planctomycetota bacterium]|nr:hypothetical protein [Planctomycetota bacterium]
TSHNGPSNGYDAFVARLSPSGGSLLYSTFIGGASTEEAVALALDAAGAATVAGHTLSSNFPTTAGAYDTSFSPGDVFVARLSPSGGSLPYSTYLGGGGDDFALALALDATGAATVAGSTYSTDFPTTAGAYDATFNGGPRDAFVARLDMLPAGASAYGASTPGCSGPLAAGVASWPQVANASFAVTCTGAPATSLGLVGLSAGSLASPLLGAGVQIWIDPTASNLYGLLPATSDSVGWAVVPLPIPALPGLAGLQAFVQFLWADPCGPLGFSGSNALALTVQP